MVQTELNIGSELKPHNQEMLSDNSINTVYSRADFDPFTSSHHSLSSPGKGTVKYWSPEFAQPYDTFLTINGKKISIQDDCGIYPTRTVYPQDGSKYHLDITGNVTASVDVDKDHPYHISYSSATTGIDWDVIWSMEREYDFTVTGQCWLPSYYSYTIHMESNGETVLETTVDKRTGSFEYRNNGVLLARYVPATDMLYGYDTNGNVDFESELKPTGYYSGTGDDFRTRWGAFTTTNLSGKMISVRRNSGNVYINLHDTSNTSSTQSYSAYNNGVKVGDTYRSMLRAYEWPTTNIVESGVLPYNVTGLQGSAGGNSFQALNYKETQNGIRKLVVFDFIYKPDGDEVTIGGIPVVFKHNGLEIQMHTEVEDEEIVVDTDSDTDTDVDTDSDIY